MAQQARPNVIGHMLDSRAQAMPCSSVVIMTLSSKRPSSQPIIIYLPRRSLLGSQVRLLAGRASDVLQNPSLPRPANKYLESIREVAEFVRIRTSPSRILTNSATSRIDTQ